MTAPLLIAQNDQLQLVLLPQLVINRPGTLGSCMQHALRTFSAHDQKVVRRVPGSLLGGRR